MINNAYTSRNLVHYERCGNPILQRNGGETMVTKAHAMKCVDDDLLRATSHMSQEP